jgi:hypothetical protein
LDIHPKEMKLVYGRHLSLMLIVHYLH